MRVFVLVSAAFVALSAAAAFQKDFREYPGEEYTDFQLPADYKEPADFVWARLMYPNGAGRGRGFRGRSDWRQGYTAWTNDYPRADRHLLLAVRRLTRVDARSVEQPVNPEDGDDIFNWPLLYMGRAGFAGFAPEHIAKIREFLDRGGFLICDDVWGDPEWYPLQDTLKQLYPDREANDLEDKSALFHDVYNLDDRYRIPGQWGIRGPGYLNGGIDPFWKGVEDDKKRVSILVWIDSDTGDSWEWADDPSYPEKYSAQGIRLAVNAITYALTH